MEVNTLPAIVQPKAVFSPHPLSVCAGRQLIYSPFKNNECLTDYLCRNNIYPIRVNDFALCVNDVRIHPRNWDRIYPKNSDLITLRATLHDGGNSDKTIRTVLSIAVLVASQGAASSLLGLAGSGAALAGTTALVAVGGMLLINALIPIKTPAAENQPSPSYSLTGTANRARLFEPLPLVFGVHRMFPDHGAKPYTFISGDDQTLVQVFNFGLSDVALSAFKIGDTNLSSFSDYVLEESIGNTGELSSYPNNVDTITGGDLVANVGVFISKVTSIDTTRIGIDLSGFLFWINDRTKSVWDARLHITVEYKLVSSGTWLSFTAANPVSINNGDRDSLRFGLVRDVPKGQYDVRVRLENTAFGVFYDQINCTTDNNNNEVCVQIPETLRTLSFTDTALTKALSWDFLKSFQPDSADYTGQKRVSLAIKASGQLSGRVDEFNALVSAKVLVWTGAAWVTQVSSNPAWQYLALARGKFDGTKRLWGAGLPDARIDIEGIKLWGAWCDAKGLSCNIIFDTKLNVDAMLNTLARCGRGASSWASGKLGIIYDEANKPVTAVFGMANIIRNTFKVSYVTGKLADEVIVAFTNPDIDYQRDTVSAVVPGVTNPINSVTIELRGITDKIQAGKEALLIAAEQFYRRRLITWESDIEGLAVQRGDVAMIAHDLTQWDSSGRLEAGSTTALTLDKPVTFTPSTQHYVGVRLPDGSYNIYDVQLAVGEQTVINLITPLPLAPDTDPDNLPVDYLWYFAPKPTPGKLIKITDVTPLSKNRVRITATDEDDNYYLSENNAYTYVPPGAFESNLPTISNLVVNETLIKVGSVFASRVNLSWEISGEYGGAFIRMKEESKPFKSVGKTLDRKFDFESPFDRTITVEVVAFNLQGKAGNNSKATQAILLVGKRGAPSDVQGFSALQNGDTMVLRWKIPVDIDLRGTVLRYGKRGSTVWEDATPLTEVTQGTSITTTDVPDGDWTFLAKHEDTSVVRNQSVNAATSDAVFNSNFDVIDQRKESPDWTGTLSNFVLHHTGVLVPSSQGDTLVLGWRVFDEFVPDPHPICTYEAAEFDIGFDDTVRISGDIQSALRGNTGGVANPKLSIDYKKNADLYDGFEDWSIGNALCQQVKHKLTLNTSEGVAIITGFNPMVDLKEHTDREQFTVAPGGTTVTFAKPFHRPPFARAEIISVDSGTLAFATVRNVTATQAEIHNYNLSSTDAGGETILDLTGV